MKCSAYVVQRFARLSDSVEMKLLIELIPHLVLSKTNSFYLSKIRQQQIEQVRISFFLGVIYFINKLLCRIVHINFGFYISFICPQN